MPPRCVGRRRLQGRRNLGFSFAPGLGPQQAEGRRRRMFSFPQGDDSEGDSSKTFTSGFWHSGS